MVAIAVACPAVDHDDCLRGNGLKLHVDAASSDTDHPAGQRVLAACRLQVTGDLCVVMGTSDQRAVSRSAEALHGVVTVLIALDVMFVWAGCHWVARRRRSRSAVADRL